MLRPKKSLGQVFITDRNLLAKVARLVEAKGKTVVEIGAGDGRLTQFLAKSAAVLYAVELDEALFAALAERFAGTPNVVPVCEDARRLRLSKIVSGLGSGEKIRVVGNLPYCSFVHIVLSLMRQLELIEEIRVMAQTELAERIMASPKTREYGRLSVAVQARAHVKRLFSLPPTAFWPKPKVASTLISILPRPTPFESQDDEEQFDRFVSAAFRHRRKTLLNSLAQSADFGSRRRADSPTGELYTEPVESALRQCGLCPTCRAQDLTVDDYLCLLELLGRQAAPAGVPGNNKTIKAEG